MYALVLMQRFRQTSAYTLQSMEGRESKSTVKQGINYGLVGSILFQMQIAVESSSEKGYG